MRPFLVPALSVGWILGVAAGSVGTVPWYAVLTGSAVAVVLAAGARLPPRARLSALGVAAAFLGLARAQTALVADRVQRASWEHLYERPVVLRGVIAAVEDRGALTRLTVGSLTRLRPEAPGASPGRKGEAGAAAEQSEAGQASDGFRPSPAGEAPRGATGVSPWGSTKDPYSLPGFLRAVVPAGHGFHERSIVVLRGTVVAPGELRPHWSPPRGSLDRIFARHQIFAAMRRPLVSVKVEGTPSILPRLRTNLRQVIHQSLPEPAAGLSSAFLLGFEYDLAADLRDAAAATGLLHLVAISGTHLGAIAAAAWGLAAFLGLPRRLAVLLTSVTLVLFLTLVGFPESGVRSGVMVLLVLWASLVGRVAAGLRILLVTVVVMTAASPRLLLGDVGFQLSALAVWGLLVLAPVLRSALPAAADRFRWITTAVVYTLAAEVATLPVALATFGRISLIAPVANVLAVGLFPFLLAASVVVLAVGGLLPALSPLLAPFAAVPATLFLGIARLGSTIPFHAVTVAPVSLPVFLGSVLLLIVVGQWASLHRRRRLVGSVT